MTSVRHLTPLLVGRLLLLATNTLLMVVLARTLDVESYGILVTIIGAQIILSRLILAGVDAGVLRLPSVPGLSHRGREIVTGGLFVIACASVVWAGIAAIAWLYRRFISRDADSGWMLVAVVAGAIGLALVDYCYSHRLGRGKFGAAAVIQGSTGSARLALTLAVVVLVPANATAVFLAYPAAHFLLGLVDSGFLLKTEYGMPKPDIFSRLLKFSAWHAASCILGALALQQGTLLLLLIGQIEDAGLFGLAIALTLPFFAVFTGFSEYLRSRIAHLPSAGEIAPFVFKCVAMAAALVAISALVLATAGFLIPQILGSRWTESIPIFYIIGAAMVLLLFQSPIDAICHYLIRPQLVLISWVLRTAISAGLGVALALSQGAVGMALAYLAAVVITIAVSCTIVLRLLASRRAGISHQSATAME